jgi:hypothetical protein
MYYNIYNRNTGEVVASAVWLDTSGWNNNLEYIPMYLPVYRPAAKAERRANSR